MTVLPCSDGITALPGAQWLTEVLAWVPDGVDPWVWLAPDEDDAPAMKLIAAMRNQFGGHAVHNS